MENTDFDLLTRMEDEYKSFSKGQKAIASYIRENYDKAAFMTAGALGRKVGVSESTVVRFAYALGYKGYPKLQKHLQEIIKNKLTTVQRLNFMEGLPADQIIDTVLKMEIANLKATREELDIQSIKDVVHYLVHARKIYVIGFRSSAPLAQFLAYYLSYIFENPQLITLGYLFPAAACHKRRCCYWAGISAVLYADGKRLAVCPEPSCENCDDYR